MIFKYAILLREKTETQGIYVDLVYIFKIKAVFFSNGSL